MSALASALPAFPDFRRLRLEDRRPFASYLREFDAYSDFTFASLWAWDIQQDAAVATLHDNLVIRLADYITGAPAHTFIGTHRIPETVATLIKYASTQGLPSELHFVPECALATAGESLTEFDVQPDRDNFDYIYSMPTMVTGPGEHRSQIRRLIRQFEQIYRPTVHDLNLHDAFVKDSILRAFETWRAVRNKDASEVASELSALQRLLGVAQHLRLAATGVSVDGTLAAFDITDLDHPKYAICAFAKADTSMTGAYPHLDSAIVHRLTSRGYSLRNYEQDLGLPGLRTAKMRCKPAYFLRKYTIAAGV